MKKGKIALTRYAMCSRCGTESRCKGCARLGLPDAFALGARAGQQHSFTGCIWHNKNAELAAKNYRVKLPA